MEINSNTTNGPVLADSDSYSLDIIGIGDLDNDGVEDIAVGASNHDEGGTDCGAVSFHNWV